MKVYETFFKIHTLNQMGKKFVYVESTKYVLLEL